MTHLAWFAIIAPSLSVLERPSRHTIWTQLPTVYQWPLSPPPHLRHFSTLRKAACSPVGGWDVPCLIKRGCGPLMNTVSISLLLLLPLIIMQCSMKEHCHPGDMIFIVCAADGGRGSDAGSEGERTEVKWLGVKRYISKGRKGVGELSTSNIIFIRRRTVIG